MPAHPKPDNNHRGRIDSKPLKTGQVAIKQPRTLAKALKMRYVDGWPTAQVAKALGLTETTLREWLTPFKYIMENQEAIQHYKANEATVMDSIRFLMAQGMLEQLQDPQRRKSLDLSRLTFGFGVVYDKMRLERGESTANVMTLSDLVKAAHQAKPINADVTEAEVVEEKPIAIEGGEGTVG